MKYLLPVAVVACGIGVAVVLVTNRPNAKPRDVRAPAPLVRILEVEPEDMRLVVHTQGTVAPRSEIDLVPEVAGRVVYVSPALVTGGFFDEDELLFRIDPRDYELAVAGAEAGVAQARVAVAREEAEAEVALREWRDLRDGTPPALVAREPQLAEARARLAAGRATLERARLDLERTELHAPFAGRVRSESIDIGQFVTRGDTVARVYAVDVAEVRLPLPADQLAYVDLPLGFRNSDAAGDGPEVELSTEFAGERYTWKGRIVRTEGEVDERSRMIQAVAAVEDPYAADAHRPPLAVGMFVEAEIAGRTLRGVYAVPRIAMRGRDRILVVTGDDHLELRPVEVVRFEEHRVLVTSGLNPGDRVCISPLDAPVDGMVVRPVDDGAGTDVP